MLGVTCLGRQPELVGKRQSHTQPGGDERQHTAWFRHRRARTNKTEQAEEAARASVYVCVHERKRGRERDSERSCLLGSQNTLSHYKVKPKLIYYVFPLTGHYSC